jgi:hypothetical protein
MIRRPGDKTPEPPGGRAAERLRMFEEARRPHPPKGRSPKKPTKQKTRSKTAEEFGAKQTRRKD